MFSGQPEALLRMARHLGAIPAPFVPSPGDACRADAKDLRCEVVHSSGGGEAQQKDEPTSVAAAGTHLSDVAEGAAQPGPADEDFASVSFEVFGFVDDHAGDDGLEVSCISASTPNEEHGDGRPRWSEAGDVSETTADHDASQSQPALTERGSGAGGDREACIWDPIGDVLRPSTREYVPSGGSIAHGRLLLLAGAGVPLGGRPFLAPVLVLIAKGLWIIDEAACVGLAKEIKLGSLVRLHGGGPALHAALGLPGF